MNLLLLTAAKAVANTALRWVPPFLPVLGNAFGASTGQLTTIIGLGEMSGLSTMAVGSRLDRGRERTVMTLSLVAVSVSSLVSLVGTTFTFAIGFVLVVVGVANCTVAGHAYISHRVAYAARARSIGLYETSWALALLIGAPIIAVLISLFGWRGPYVVLAFGAAAMAVAVWRSAERARPAEESPVRTAPPRWTSITPQAWSVIIGSALLAMAGLSVFAVSGAWLDDAFGVSTGGLGAVAMGFGAIELVASTGSAGLADRFGKLRSTLIGIVLVMVGQTTMAVADETLWIGVIGILIFLLGFEFAIVTSFSLVTEAMPDARGTTIAMSSGISTVARGSGTIAGGLLFGAYGVEGTLTLSAVAVVLAAAALLFSRRGRV